MLNLILSILKPKPQPINGRQIFLASGEKVVAPPKPEKVRVSYSIVPDNNLSLEEYILKLKLRKLEASKQTIRKFYL